MKEIFEVIDRQDAKGFSEFFTEGGTFKFGNNPTVTGRQGIEAYVTEFFSSLESLSHDLIDEWDQKDDVISEVEVTYVRNDGKEVRLPAATIGRREGDLLRDYRIFMDVNPLFQ
jgi:ketosteroid isomerase-like protein